jgi:hypothetical protein
LLSGRAPIYCEGYRVCLRSLFGTSSLLWVEVLSGISSTS